MKAGKGFSRTVVPITLLSAAMGLAPSVQANQVFTASSNTGAGDPISASADFTVTAGNVAITLTDTLLLSALKNSAQLLSDISFSVFEGPTSVTKTGVSAPSSSNLVTFVDGSAPVLGTGSGNGWTFGLNNGSFGTGSPIGGGTYLLTALVGNPLGSPVAPTVTSSNGASFCLPNKCPDGLANQTHNPMFNGSVTFSLALTGVEAGAAISNVFFSFGTAPEGESVVPGVPIPAAVWLFGSGLLGLIGIARRRQNGSNTAEPNVAVA